MRAYYIPGGVAGTLATLESMRQLARASAVQFARIRTWSHVDLRALDGILRGAWHYIPDGVHESIREPVSNIALQGDCDDAATYAAAIVLGRFLKAETTRALHCDFVAARSPGSAEFDHVFIRCVDAVGVFKIDPTAPVDADYSAWEVKTLKFL